MAKKRKKRIRRKKTTPLDRLHREFRRKDGGLRHTSLRILGGKLDKNGPAFHKEHLQFEDDKDGPRILDVVQISTPQSAVRTLNYWRDKGQLKATKFARRVWYLREELEKFLRIKTENGDL